MSQLIPAFLLVATISSTAVAQPRPHDVAAHLPDEAQAAADASEAARAAAESDRGPEWQTCQAAEAAGFRMKHELSLVEERIEATKRGQRAAIEIGVRHGVGDEARKLAGAMALAKANDLDWLLALRADQQNALQDVKLALAALCDPKAIEAIDRSEANSPAN